MPVDRTRYLHVTHLYGWDQWLRSVAHHDLGHNFEVTETEVYLEVTCHTCRRIEGVRLEGLSADQRAVALREGFVVQAQRAYREDHFSSLWDRLVSEDSLVS